MLTLNVNYNQFRAARTFFAGLVPAVQFIVIFIEVIDPEQNQFRVIGSPVGLNCYLQFASDVRPPTFNVDFPNAVQVLDFSSA